MPSKTGVLLLNIGTPSQPTNQAVRRYLQEFLTDRRMINLPDFIRYPLVYGLIAPLRASKSAQNYQKIWCKIKGSPLLYFSSQCKKKLQEKLGSKIPVVLGMRYGQPSIEQALKDLMARGCDRIILFPQYPQYASATTASSIGRVYEVLNKYNNFPQMTNISHFYNNSSYIQAVANKMLPFVQAQNPEKIILSYHGLPIKQIEKSEKQTPAECYQGKACPKISQQNHYCYRAQCFATTLNIANALGLPLDQFETVFQSRVGPVSWIEPSFTSKLHELAGKSIKNVLVACPSFVVDCLETLEEIAIAGKQEWLNLGGQDFSVVPCLNDDSVWIEAMAKIIAAHQF